MIGPLIVRSDGFATAGKHWTQARMVPFVKLDKLAPGILSLTDDFIPNFVSASCLSKPWCRGNWQGGER